MPWLGIRGNGTLSHALPRKFRLARRPHQSHRGQVAKYSLRVTMVPVDTAMFDTAMFPQPSCRATSGPAQEHGGVLAAEGDAVDDRMLDVELAPSIGHVIQIAV